MSNFCSVAKFPLMDIIMFSLEIKVILNLGPYQKELQVICKQVIWEPTITEYFV
jgi:hypothetical protein